MEPAALEHVLSRVPLLAGTALFDKDHSRCRRRLRPFCARESRAHATNLRYNERRAKRGCGSMVEPEPSKLMTRVRFPSPAPSDCQAEGTLPSAFSHPVGLPYYTEVQPGFIKAYARVARNTQAAVSHVRFPLQRRRSEKLPSAG